MLKFIFLTILSAIIFFFVWNFLRKFFFQFPPEEPRKRNTNSTKKSSFKWDAETIEYEEIIEKKDTKNS